MSASHGEDPTSGERVYLHIYDYETKEFSGLTTYHGLVRIYNSNTWPSRIFWCVVVLSCLSLFMVHSGYLLFGYHSKPTLFQVNTIVSPDGIHFPDITICSRNSFPTPQLTGYNMSNRVLAYVLASFEDHALFPNVAEEHMEFERFRNIHRERTASEFSIADFLRNVRPKCEDMVIGCSFAGLNIENCCENSEAVVTDLGYCIRFPNVKNKYKQVFSGADYGWQYILAASRGLPSDLSWSSENGFYIAIHETSKETSMRSHAVSVSLGVSLYAGIFVKNITLLKRTDWGMCQDDWNPIVHGPVLTDLQYTSLHCEWNCIAREWLHNCDCLPVKFLGLNILTNASICTPLSIHNCSDFVYENASKCDCDVECQQIDYETQTSYSDVAANFIQRRVSLAQNYTGENISVVNVFMRSVAYERHEQQKQLQTADLLSNIAGSMGLFLGMSTVTLLEIFIYLFKSVWGTVNNERQRQFMDAMMEEENERRQSLVILEEPLRKASPHDIEPEDISSHTPRRSPRISIIPQHTHKGRRESSAIPFRELPVDGYTPIPHRSVLSLRRISLVGDEVGRRNSAIEASMSGLLPNVHSQRKSIAVGTFGRRESAMESAGEILPVRPENTTLAQRSHRRSSFASSTPRLSVQPNDDAIHLMVNRRRSSVHPKHFLI